jgi:hypothetical protein
MEVEIAADDTDDDYRSRIDDNFLETYVEYSRSNQVLNEEQSLVTLMIYATGLLPHWSDYAGGIITGGSSSGKSHMKRDVIDASFDYKTDWLYQISGGSQKAAIDDDDIDDARIGAFNEFQKVPDEMREFLKSVVEDGGFTYARNVADSDRESGRKTTKIERDPLPIVFMIADENETEVGQEMKTRLIEVKVDENQEKNRGVHRAKWGHTDVQLSRNDHEYMRDDPELEHAVKSHVRDVPVDTDVVIPTDAGRFEGDNWDAAHVVENMLSFKRSESTRASTALKSLAKSSTLLNYHSRQTVEHDGEQKLVMEPQDVGNILDCWNVLVATTHGLTSKKFAIIDAILERGGKSASSSTARQADKDTVIGYIQDNPDIATMSKTEIGDLLNQLDEDLIVNKKDHPEDARKNIYEYDGSRAFETPDIFAYYDQFESVTSPVDGVPIEQKLEWQLERFNASMSLSDFSASDGMETDTEDTEKDENGSLTDFDDTSDTDGLDLSEVERAVAAALSDTVDGYTVPPDVVESDSFKTGHWVGCTPVTYEDDTVRPEREPRAADRQECVMDPENDFYGDNIGIGDTLEIVEQALTTLQAKGVFEIENNDDGSVTFSVDA